MGLSGIIKSQVSKLCKEVDERLHAFLDRPLAIAVNVSAVSDPYPPPAGKVGLGSTWAEPRCHANGRNRRD
jgi:hypothetical protein